MEERIASCGENMKVYTLNIQDSSEQQRASYFQYKF